MFRLHRQRTPREQWQRGEKLTRKGKTQDAEQALLEAAKSPSPLDRHYAYVKLIQLYQKMIGDRLDKENELKEICMKDIELFPDFFEAWMIEYLYSVPSPYFPSFGVLADIYEKENKIDEAIDLCELAVGYNLKETVGPDYPERLEKLYKKKSR